MSMPRSIRLVVAAAGLLALSAGLAEPAPRRPKMDPFLHRLVQGQGVAVDPQGRQKKIDRQELEHYARFLAINVDSDPPTASVRLRLDAYARARLETSGIRVYGAHPEIASAIIPIDRLGEVAGVTGIDRMQIVAIPQPELDISLGEINADQAAAVYNAHGSGVIVGIVDTGSDTTHPNFLKADGTTRFHMVWNQDDRCVGIPPPAPFDFGCLFTEGDINTALGGGAGISFPDADGHGTHVMATAAGDGSATGNGQPAFQYIGPADQATLITVKTFPEPGLPGSCTTCFQIGLGLDFIDAMATLHGMPYSVNLSLGSSFGGHDGGDIDEVLIDSLTGPGIGGRVIVKSAGNNRGAAIHASGVVSAGTFNDHTFTIPNYTAAPGTFNDIHAWSMWYDGGDDMTVTISDPGGGCPGNNSVTCTTGDGFVGIGTNSGAMICDDTGSPAANGARFFELELDDQIGPTPCRGTWTFRVTGNVINDTGRYDMWIWFSSLGTSGLAVNWNAPDFSQLISVPGTAFNVTTVGAYKTKQSWTNVDGSGFQWTDTGVVGNIASFSSPGPSRDGRLKPEITAPGFGVVSALSSDVPASEVGPGGASRALVQRDGVHWILPGTSFSAPHVTGVFAQLLGLNPTLDAIQLRTLVTDTARTDPFTELVSATPNNDWGHGKVDALAAAEALIKNIPDLMLSGSTGTWTGIATADTYNVYRVDDIDLLDGSYTGSCDQSGLATPTFTDASAPPGVGEVFVYYVTGVKNGVEGLIRINSDGTGLPPSNPC